jgi:hypothetical protein
MAVHCASKERGKKLMKTASDVVLVHDVLAIEVLLETSTKHSNESTEVATVE